MVEYENAPKTIQRDSRNRFQMLCSGFKSPACSHLDLILLQTCTCALHLYSTINYSLLLQRSFRATLSAAGLKCLITEVQQGLETAADRSLARSPHVLAMFWCCCAAGRKAWWPLTACTVRVAARPYFFFSHWYWAVSMSGCSTQPYWSIERCTARSQLVVLWWTAPKGGVVFEHLSTLVKFVLSLSNILASLRFCIHNHMYIRNVFLYFFVVVRISTKNVYNNSECSNT